MMLNVEPTPKSRFFATTPKAFGAKTQNPTKVIGWYSLFCEILCFGVFCHRHHYVSGIF